MADETGHTSFLGTGWAFPPEFEPNVGALMVSDERDVQQSLHILFSTALGERLFAPNYGLDMQQLLFEPLGTTAKTLLEDRIRTTILIYEPRIKLLELSLDTSSEILAGRVVLTLDYIVKSTNSRFNLVYPFYNTDSNELVGKP